jgi:hypothetical protein
MKPKIGKFRVPKVRLKILLGELNDLYKKFGNMTFNVQEFANVLHISETSSGLLLKISELKNLQLIKSDGNLIKITDSGVMVLAEDRIERRKEIEAVVKKIGLWNELLKEHENLNESTFPAILKRITGLDDQILKMRIKEIKWAYTEDINCIQQFDPNASKKAISHKKTTVLKNAPLNQIHTAKFTANNQMHLQKPIIWTVSTDFGDFQTEIVDELSHSNAKSITIQMLDTIERKIKNNY